MDIKSAIGNFLGRLKVSSGKKGSPAEDYKIHYQQGRYYGVLWHWKLQGGNIAELLPCCPTCDVRLICYEDLLLKNTIFCCERCGYESLKREETLFSLKDRIIKEISVSRCKYS